MRKIGFAVMLLVGALSPAWAQVTVEVSLEQEQYLPGESLVAAVHITNRSGQTLRLGRQEDWLTFTMDSRDANIVARQGDPPVAGEFNLPSSKTATKRVDLQPWFALSQPGHYSVTANVRVPGWDRLLTSAAKGFDIIEGTKLWQEEFGVPRAPGSTNALPEVRKYCLQQANYLKEQLRLYLRISNPEGTRVFRVCSLGQLISFSRPEARLDKVSNIHVLYQNGPSAFSYSSHSPDGELLLRQTYDFVKARPRLQVDENGAVSVVNGVRRLTTQDFPPSGPPADLLVNPEHVSPPNVVPNPK